jgi:hypothetical protein
MFSLQNSKDIEVTQQESNVYRTVQISHTVPRTYACQEFAQRKWTPIALADMFYYHLGSRHGIVLGQKQLQLEYSTLHNIFYKTMNKLKFCMTNQNVQYHD